MVLGSAFGKPGLTVDTHFGRLARRLGMTEETDPVKVEKAVGPSSSPRSGRTCRSGWSTTAVACATRAYLRAGVPGREMVPQLRSGETDPEEAEKLLAYELKPGREELLEKFRAGYTRRQLQAEGYPLSA